MIMKRRKFTTKPDRDPWGHRDPYNLGALDSRMLLKYLRLASNGLDQVESFEHDVGRQVTRAELEAKFGFDPLAFTRVGPSQIITVAEIKAELRRRPHIMRRLERAAVRRASALSNRGKSKSRNR
jgi:hypothetical protein